MFFKVIFNLENIVARQINLKSKYSRFSVTIDLHFTVYFGKYHPGLVERFNQNDVVPTPHLIRDSNAIDTLANKMH